MTPAAVKRLVRQRDGHCCTGCGISDQEYRRVAGKSLEVHRLVPGSPYTVEGSALLCGVCHASKPKSKHGHSDKVRVILPRATFLEALGLESLDGLNLSVFLLQLLRALPRERVRSAAAQAPRSQGRLLRLRVSEELHARLNKAALDDDIPGLLLRIIVDSLPAYEAEAAEIRRHEQRRAREV